MKPIFSAFLLFLAASINAQEIRLGIYPIKQTGSLTSDQLATARTKITSLVAAQGIASADASAPLGVLPEIVLYEPRTVAAGTRNLTTIEGELVLTVRQLGETGAIIGSKSKKFAASGRDLAQAKSQLMAALPVNDASWQPFFVEMKAKSADFFVKNCPQLIADADRDAATGNYARSLSALLNIPSGSACRADADARLATTYSRAREVICQKSLTQARAAAAVKNYELAAASLRAIDPEAACFSEVKSFVAEMQGHADADFKTTLDALTEYWKAESSFENRRLEVIQDFLKNSF